MSVQITWIGHASFRITDGKNVVYIDPWKVPSEPHDADIIFVSHSHFDHCSPPDIAKVSKNDTAVIAPSETIAKLHAANATLPGDVQTIREVTIESVAAYNIGKTFHPRGHNWCGAVITIGGKKIYYAGDTDKTPEMSNLKDVDLALLPVGGTYTLNASEAAEACKVIGCKSAIPYHWGDVVGTEADAKEFARLAACKVHVLKPGQSLTI
jgi:L-ascorbate metabolism protein UlaG (beta-lactamase superfamily)